MFTYPNVPRCHHINVNGTRCGSPALRDHKLCFFHQRWREQRIPMGMSRKHSLELPVLEDANSIQMTITQVMRLVLSQTITLKEAGILFYGLQIAAANLRQPRSKTRLHTPRSAFIRANSAERKSKPNVPHSAEGVLRRPSAPVGMTERRRSLVKQRFSCMLGTW